MSTDLALQDLPTTTIEDLKKTFQSMSAHAAVEMLHEYLELLRATDDPEVKRKGLVFLRENANMEAPKPKEDRQDYPVFNFVIGSASAPEAVQVVATHPDGTVQTLEFTPTEVMAANAYVNADVAFDDE